MYYEEFKAEQFNFFVKTCTMKKFKTEQFDFIVKACTMKKFKTKQFDFIVKACSMKKLKTEKFDFIVKECTIGAIKIHCKSMLCHYAKCYNDAKCYAFMILCSIITDFAKCFIRFLYPVFIVRFLFQISMTVLSSSTCL